MFRNHWMNKPQQSFMRPTTTTSQSFLRANNDIFDYNSALILNLATILARLLNSNIFMYVPNETIRPSLERAKILCAWNSEFFSFEHTQKFKGFVNFIHILVDYLKSKYTQFEGLSVDGIFAIVEVLQFYGNKVLRKGKAHGTGLWVHACLPFIGLFIIKFLPH